jgi:hypothetical protein
MSKPRKKGTPGSLEKEIWESRSVRKGSRRDKIANAPFEEGAKESTSSGE